MLSSKTITFIVGAFAANGIELNEGAMAVIEAALEDQDEELVHKATTNALKKGERMSLAAINKELAELKGERVSKKDAAALAERAFALLRYPQRTGQSAAQNHDPEAYALLTSIGSWWDVHNRSEFDLKGLKQDLKELAPKVIKERQQAALTASTDERLKLAPETQPRPSLEVFVPDPDIARKIEEMTKANLAKLKAKR